MQLVSSRGPLMRALHRRQFVLAFALFALARGRDARGADAPRVRFSFYYAFDCPHCKKAKPFVVELQKRHPALHFEYWEVKKDKEGRRRFSREVKRLGIQDPGVPLFVCGDEYVLGWEPPKTARAVRRMIRRVTQPNR